jgi:predicted TIM-barrel fold metal-dependent hydrolase
VQIYTNPKMIAALKDQLAASPIPVVLDHFAGAQAALGPDQPGFADVLDLVKGGKAYVKISAPYQVSKIAPDYANVAPLAKALIAANPDRILWGTDWPHPDSVTPPGKKPTDVTPLLQIDDGRLLNQLPAWAPDAKIREKILVANPARLYGFEGKRA